MPVRYDQGLIQNWSRTPQGGLRVPAYPTRVGVFVYQRPDGTTQREYRPAEEVHHADSLASLKHAPVTDLHPEREGVRIPVTPENYRELAVGHVAETVHADGNMVAADLLIQDQDMILKVEQGTRRELSCGYDCVLDATPGVDPVGDVYDVIQRQIRYNHVGLGPVGWGRAGPTVALRLDSGDGIQIERDQVKVMKETIDGKEYTVGTPEWAAAWKAFAAKQQARADGLAADLAKSTVDPKVQEAAIQRRVRLITDCQKLAAAAGLKFDEAAAAGMSEGDMVRQAILALDPTAEKDLEGLDPAGIMGFFKAMIKSVASKSAAGAPETGQDGGTDQDKVPAPGTPPAGQEPEKKTDGKAAPSIFTARTGTHRQDGKDQPAGQSNQRQDQKGPDADAARKGMIDRQNTAWKNPLASHK